MMNFIDEPPHLNTTIATSSSYDDERTKCMLTVEEKEEKGGRWPRQEALALLEVRARMDSSFRLSPQKAPLWDELSRIMEEEYGYKRSGKKCREKLENLYKYYKKTKQGKEASQDGRHYRFFRQLDALYGDRDNNDSFIFTDPFNATTNSKQVQNDLKADPSFYHSLSFSSSYSTECDSSSSEDEFEDQDLVLQRELMEMETRRLVEVQKAWIDKILKTVDQLEGERIYKEELKWREKAEQFELEQRIWTAEQERIKARNDIIMESLERISNKGLRFPYTSFEISKLMFH